MEWQESPILLLLPTYNSTIFGTTCVAHAKGMHKEEVVRSHSPCDNVLYTLHSMSFRTYSPSICSAFKGRSLSLSKHIDVLQ